jgi:hypothetical protein
MFEELGENLQYFVYKHAFDLCRANAPRQEATILPVNYYKIWFLRAGFIFVNSWQRKNKTR